MKKTFVAFFKHYIFWLVIFIFFRAIFLITVLPVKDTAGFFEILHTLIAGFRLDISAASYLAIIPFLLTCIAIPGGDTFFLGAVRWYYSIILLVVIVMSLSNIIIFSYWGTLLNSRGLAYVTQPGEMLASVSTLQLAGSLTLILALFLLLRLFYRRFLHPSFEEINGTSMQRLGACVLLLPVIGIGIRGGLQLIPVNESVAVFSSHRELNQVATNNIWYLGHNIYQSGITGKNPYQWMSAEEARAITSQLVSKDTKVEQSIFHLHGKPNVVFILLESWTADIIEPLGGLKGVTPHFSRLASEGLLFTHVFSSGFRTDQALVSVLSGFPAQPNNSIIRFPDKTVQLPSITSEFKKKNYATSFFYGGELEFANMNNYLAASGFQHLTGIDEFASNTLNSKWGAHDGFVLDKQFDFLQKEKQPFFSTLLTLSTHEPFEVPLTTPFNGNSEPERFKKAAWYTDKCLGDYFEKVRQTSWYQNTIFVLVADHGHHLPLERNYIDPFIRRIPVLIISPLLHDSLKGQQNPVIAGQHDIAATLLSSLNMDHQNFEWSNNMLNPSRTNFAYLNLDMSVTWIRDSTVVNLPLEAGVAGLNAESPESKNTKAYLQQLYTTFLGY